MPEGNFFDDADKMDELIVATIDLGPNDWKDVTDEQPREPAFLPAQRGSESL